MTILYPGRGYQQYHSAAEADARTFGFSQYQESVPGALSIETVPPMV
jgi:hypothetical protein